MTDQENKLIQARLEALNRIFNILKNEYDFYNTKYRIKSNMTINPALLDEPFQLLYQRKSKLSNTVTISTSTTPPDKFRISTSRNNNINSSQFSSPDANSPLNQKIPKIFDLSSSNHLHKAATSSSPFSTPNPYHRNSSSSHLTSFSIIQNECIRLEEKMIQTLAMQYVLSPKTRPQILTSTKTLVFVCSYRSQYANDNIILRQYPEIAMLLKHLQHNQVNIQENSALYFALKCLQLEINKLSSKKRARNITESSSVFVNDDQVVTSPGMHVVDDKIMNLAENKLNTPKRGFLSKIGGFFGNRSRAASETPIDKKQTLPLDRTISHQPPKVQPSESSLGPRTQSSPSAAQIASYPEFQLSPTRPREEKTARKNSREGKVQNINSPEVQVNGSTEPLPPSENPPEVPETKLLKTTKSPGLSRKDCIRGPRPTTHQRAKSNNDVLDITQFPENQIPKPEERDIQQKRRVSDTNPQYGTLGKGIHRNRRGVVKDKESSWVTNIKDQVISWQEIRFKSEISSSGYFGKVYQAESHGTKIVRVIDPMQSKQLLMKSDIEQAFGHFKREIQNWTYMRHDNIILFNGISVIESEHWETMTEKLKNARSRVNTVGSSTVLDSRTESISSTSTEGFQKSFTVSNKKRM